MKKTNFAEVLDAATSLPLDAREELVQILRMRAIEERRQEMARDIKSARSEHRRKACRPVSAREMMQELLA